MQGRIIKGIGGFYYVHTKDGVYTCKAKGAFRKDKIKPLVGDLVEIEVMPDEDMVAGISDILPRSNELIRPSAANVEQALIIFALKSPDPNFVTLDKMILQYKVQNIPVIICFNKDDLVSDEYTRTVKNDYSKSGCKVYITSVAKQEGIRELKEALSGKTTVVAGPSGAGKSSIVNELLDEAVMETGDISEKLLRGKHTTRHSQIIPINDDTFIMDTPGFSSFELFNIKAEDLAPLYEEFVDYTSCKFMPCSHTHEPMCGVKDAVDEGLVSTGRYNNYVYIYNEILKSRRY